MNSVDDPDSCLADALKQAQIDVEKERSALARSLHDDLGGFLVAAIMDIGWTAAHPDLPEVVRCKLSRAQGLLRAAIDVKRELIERLRPTLLDNVGLFTTLRWHMKTRCEAAAIPYTANLPASEQALSPEIRVGIFRIFQEALTHVISTYRSGDLSLEVKMDGDTLHCHLVHQAERHFPDGYGCSFPETWMHHRAKWVGGSVRWEKMVTGSHMHLAVPTLQ